MRKNGGDAIAGSNCGTFELNNDWAERDTDVGDVGSLNVGGAAVDDAVDAVQNLLCFARELVVLKC